MMTTIFTPELERLLKISARTALRVGGGILAPSDASASDALPAGGTEVTALRDYSTGDDPRRIDWGICARHDELWVRIYGGTAQRNTYVLLDSSYGMSFSPQKLKAAKCAAAAAAYGLLASGALLEFGTFTPDLTLFPVLSHTQKIGKFLRFLEESDFSDAPNIVNFDFLAESFLSLNRRPGDVYILSDFFGESDSFRKDFAAGFDLLRQAGFPPRVIHLTAPSDRAENLVGDVDIFDPSRDYRQIITLTERDLAAYQRLYDAYITEVEAFCSQRKIPYTRISSGSPLDVLCFTALGLPEASARVNPWREYITP